MLLTFQTGILAAVALAVVRAEECRDGAFRSLESQALFDSRVKALNCTTIRGELSLAPTYSDSTFILNNITSIWIIAVYGDTIDGRYVSPNLTSIEMPHLVTVEKIFIEPVPPGLSVSAPKVKDLVTLSVRTGNVELSFPSLEIARDINLEGIILKHDFKQLARINSTLTVCTNEHCTLDPGEAQELNFPSLQNAQTISINGSLSGISMPLLAGVGSEPSRLPGIAINNAGEPLNVDFPQLSYANKLLDFIGNFERISLPSLGSAKSIEIQANSPFDVNLTSLLNVTHLSLLGNISSATFSELLRADSIIINSTVPFDCSSFDSATANAKANPLDDGLLKGPYTCDQKSTGARVGIEVGFGIVVIAALAAIL